MRESKKKKILIIRLSSLGDVLLTYPLISLLRKKEPEAQIDFLVKQKFIDAIKFNPYLNSILSLTEENLKDIKSIIRKNSYDIVIDLQNNLRSHQLYPFSFKTKIFRFKKPTLKKLLLVLFKLNLLKNNFSIAYHYIKTLYPDFKQYELDLYFNIPSEKEVQSFNKIPSEFAHKKIIGICPGAKHFTKRYPVEKFKILIEKLIEKDFAVAIFGGTEDKEICTALEIHPSVKNFQNENDLLETASLMKKCTAIITNDSGLMHLASLIKIPVVAIFGSTVKEFGFFPIYKNSVIVENQNLSCRPCSHIGKSECPKKHFKCMNEIQPETILRKTLQLIDESR